MAEHSERLERLIRHITNVRDDCVILGEKLAARGEEPLAIQLVANGHVHDASKFRGIEWEYLNDGAFPFPTDNGVRLAGFQLALHQHVSTNPHHPEYWGSIEEMPRVFLGEMICDWHSRSSEQGTDLLGWVKEKATEKFKFSTCGRVYKELKELIDLLLERKFTK